jgi:NifU-like protein involved in Fe-S cluster formation
MRYSNKNTGRMKNPDITGTAKAMCGDETTFYLRIRNDKVKRATFETSGCSVAIASASAVTEIIKDKSLDEIQNLEEQDIIDKIGNVELVKLHCVRYVLAAIKDAVNNYKKIHS